MLRLYSQKTLSESGKAFGINNYRTVSTAIERMKKTLDRDPNVDYQFEEILYGLLIKHYKAKRYNNL